MFTVECRWSGRVSVSEGESSSISAELSRPMNALSGISTDMSVYGWNCSCWWIEIGDKGVAFKLAGAAGVITRRLSTTLDVDEE